MCCRLTIQPLSIEIATAVLLTGEFYPMFVDIPQVAASRQFYRDISLDDGSQHRVVARMEPENDALRLELSPSISQYMQHAAHRIDGGVYFEIAAKYAEKVGGVIKQLANVSGCVEAGGINEKILASYPSRPMMWEQVCRGFQEAILGHTHEGVI